MYSTLEVNLGQVGVKNVVHTSLGVSLPSGLRQNGCPQAAQFVAFTGQCCTASIKRPARLQRPVGRIPQTTTETRGQVSGDTDTGFSSLLVIRAYRRKLGCSQMSHVCCMQLLIPI